MSIPVSLCHYAECQYAECHDAECHNAECHNAEYIYAKCHYAECRTTSGINWQGKRTSLISQNASEYKEK